MHGATMTERLGVGHFALLLRSERAPQVETCWDRAVVSAGGLEARYAAAAEFNKGSRFRKRGIAVTPTKFGISFTTKFLNQVRRPCDSSMRPFMSVWEPIDLLCTSLHATVLRHCISIKTDQRYPLADIYHGMAGEQS